MPTKEELITPIDIRCKQREAFKLKFTVRSKITGAAVELSSDCTCFFVIKESKSDTEYLVSKTNADMHLSDIESGIIYVPLTSSDLDMYGRYVGEFEVVVSTINIKKSVDLRFYIIPSVR